MSLTDKDKKWIRKRLDAIEEMLREMRLVSLEEKVHTLKARQKARRERA